MTSAVALFLPFGGVFAETTSTAVGSVSATAVTTLTPTPEDLVKQGQALIDQAGQVANTITTTVATVENVYNRTKVAIDQGKKIYEQGKVYYGKAKVFWASIQPWIDKAKPWWDKLSNHNDPKRLAIIFGVVLIVYLSWRWNGRRRSYYDRF